MALDTTPERRGPGRTAGSLALAGMLLVGTLAAYAPVLEAGFVSYDDPRYVTGNPLVLEGLDPDNLVRAFTSVQEVNWIPLVWVSFMVDHALWGLEPAGYHATNLALHAIATLLLFAALRRLTGAPGRSAFVAGLFALHPLHVESVAWITERKDVLSGTFWMAALLGYAHYVERPSALRYSGIALPFAAGLLSKATLVSLPFVLLLLDWWPADRYRDSDGRIRGGRGLRLVAEKLPLLVLAAGASAITLATQRAGGAVLGAPVWLSERMANALLAYVAYLRKTLWPSDLIFFYPHEGFSGAGPELSSPEVGLAALLLVALTGLAAALAWRRWDRSPLLVGWLWFLGTLVPMLGLVQVGVQALADRYTYIPLVGLGIAAAWGSAHVLSRLAAGTAGRRVAMAAAAVILGACAIATHVQAGYWRDSETLYRRALEVDPDNYMAHYEMARLLNSQGRHAEAELHAREALDVLPRWGDAELNLAVALVGQDRHQEAIRVLYRTLSRSRDPLQVQLLLANSLLESGRYEQARAQLRDVVALVPGHLPARLALAEASEELGDRPTAFAHYEAILSLGPETPEARTAARRLVELVDAWDEAPLARVERAHGLAQALARSEPEAFGGAAQRLRERAAGSGAPGSGRPSGS